MPLNTILLTKAHWPQLPQPCWRSSAADWAAKPPSSTARSWTSPTPSASAAPMTQPWRSMAP
jgi:hypothetical protein